MPRPTIKLSCMLMHAVESDKKKALKETSTRQNGLAGMQY